ncbi:MAG: type IX secretion system plug protein [Bacteroidota bacterium]
MKRVLIVLLVVCSAAYGAPDIDIIGLRVYADDDEYQPPIVPMYGRVTIEFDVTTSLAPNLQIIFTHASMDWQADENQFVNDPAKIRTDQLTYTPAPAGAYQYTFRYKNSFPNSRNQVAFTYSGNYLFRIVNADDNDRVLVEGKFIVAEETVPASVRIENRYHPGSTDPYNQVNYVAVTVNAPAEYRADDRTGVLHSDITAVDIIKNWNIDRPYRIDLNNRTAETFVENFTRPVKTFWIRNIPAGNEYRKLDLSNTTMYPNRKRAVPVGGPDVSRFQWQGKPDANGASKLRPFTGANSDYLEVDMRLRLANPLARNVYLVGSFNGWEVRPVYRMEYDTVTQLLTFRHWLRRGVYDYQYVTGDEDGSGTVVNQDWIALEGNDWRTTNRFVALVYYKDRRFGGFDRIVGMVKARSPGGNVNDHADFPPVSDKTVTPIHWK